jgi:hypothetical protein
LYLMKYSKPKIKRRERGREREREGERGRERERERAVKYLQKIHTPRCMYAPSFATCSEVRASMMESEMQNGTKRNFSRSGGSAGRREAKPEA